MIKVDRGYVHRLDEFEFVPGIFPLARFWNDELRRPIVVVSNQSGIGRTALVGEPVHHYDNLPVLHCAPLIRCRD